MYVARIFLHRKTSVIICASVSVYSHRLVCFSFDLLGMSLQKDDMLIIQAGCRAAAFCECDRTRVQRGLKSTVEVKR